MLKKEIEFDEWLALLDGHATVLGGYKGSMVEQTGKDCWREFYNDGYTPYDAYVEDLRSA